MAFQVKSLRRIKSQERVADNIFTKTGPGLDHGVFVPFRIMFGHDYQDLPIVQVSIDSSMSPEKNWEVGSAVSKLRSVRTLHPNRGSRGIDVLN